MKHTRLVNCTAIMILLLLSLTLEGCFSLGKKPDVSDYDSDIAVQFVQGEGIDDIYVLEVEITNNSEHILDGWSMSFESDFRVREIMDCTFEQRGKLVEAESSAFNSVILPGETYRTSIIMKKGISISNFVIEGRRKPEVLVISTLSNGEFRYDKDMNCFIVPEEINELLLSCDQGVVFTDYEARNCDGDVFKQGKVNDDTINDTGLDIGYNELKLYGILDGKEVISIIKIMNLNYENAIKAGFDLESDNDDDGIADHFEKRLGFDSKTSHSVSQDRTDYEILFSRKTVLIEN